MREPIRVEIPQPEQISVREREDAMGAYLMMFASVAAGLPLPGINLIAAIIYYSINKQKSKFVKFHSIQSLYSQIPVSILNAIIVIWFILSIFTFADLNVYYWISVAFTVLVNIVYFAYSIYAAIQARKGRLYYLVLFGEYAFDKAFVEEEENIVFENRPPSL